jgi:protein-disulfide isomerase
MGKESRLLSIIALVLSIGASGLAAYSTFSHGSGGQAPTPEEVKASLLQNPQMVVDAIELLQAQKREQSRQASIPLTIQYAKELESPTEGFLGNPNGKKIVVEFFDNQCPHCKETDVVLNQEVAKDPALKVILREFPVLGPASEAASRLAVAAARQGKYMQAHEALMAAPAPFDGDTLMNVAKQIGLDIERAKKDMASAETTKELQDNLSLARRVGITGTPGFAKVGAGEMEGYKSHNDFEAFVQTGSNN